MDRSIPRRLLPLLGLLTVAALSAANRPLSPRLAPETVHEFRQAASEARRGQTPLAMAILEGLLLDHPVTVAIDRNRSDEYADGVAQAVAAWARALPDSPFRITAPGERADVTVQFVPAIEGGGDTQGLVSVRRHFSWSGDSHRYELTGSIQIRDRAFGHRLTGEQIGRVLAHELGHILGLGDDYDGPGVMGAFRADSGPIDPSPEEVEALTEFRNDLRDRLRHTRGA